MEPLVRQVDHVFVPVDDPAPLHALFTETLGLPESWPVHDYGLFRSGGVTFGNCNMEFVSGPTDLNPFFEARLPATVRGVGFEPMPGADWAAALDARKLRHTDPYPFEGKGCRREGRLWTTMFVGGLVADAAAAFLCEYHTDECVRGAEAAEALHRAGGGIIGAERVAEITIGAQDMEVARRRWERFLSPLPAVAPDRWEPGDGPAIQLRSSPIDGVAGLTVKVRSLAEARESLLGRGMLGPVRKHGMGLHYAGTHGLDVWLVE